MRYKSLPHAVRTQTPSPLEPPRTGAPPRSPRPRRLRDILATIPIVLLLPALLLPFIGAHAAVGGSLIASPSELAALPTSGSAWTSLKAVADASPGSPDLTDQDNKHGIRTLAIALVANRLDSDAYRARARSAILSAMGTERVGADNSILSLGRQLGAYVLAADLIGLSGDDDAAFRTWLSPIRTRELGGHGRYTSLKGTCEDSPHNWGTFACASLVAANLYLGDDAAIDRSWRVFRGLTGDRAAYSGFQDMASDAWACPGVAFTPANSLCPGDAVRYGAFVKDVTRGDDPPTASGAGLSYTAEILQGVALQAELLARAGYTDAWARLRPAFDWARRNGAMNLSSVDYHVTWWANRRLGWTMATKPATSGRVFAYTDWLYGPVAAVPAATPTPTAKPTATPTPTPKPTVVIAATPSPTTGATTAPTAGPTATAAPLPTATPTQAPAPTSTPAPTDAPPTGSDLDQLRSADATVVDATEGANTTSTELTIDRPDGVESGDVLVAAIDVRGKPAIVAPEGWKRLHVASNGTILQLATYVRTASGAEPGAYTWTFDRAQAAAGVIVAVRGADAEPIADVAGRTNGKSSSIAAPDARADASDSLVLAFFAAGQATSITPPADMKELAEAASTAGKYKTTLEVAAAAADEGSVAGLVARMKGSSASAAQVIVVRP